jgi:hypothetical protein
MPTNQHGRLSLALGLSYNQAMIYQYQYTNENPNGTPASPQPINGVQGPSGDQYLYSHLQLDAQGDFRIRNGLTMWISGLNLTNEVFGFYNGSPIYLDQREFYKPTYSIGMRWEPRLER